MLPKQQGPNRAVTARAGRSLEADAAAHAPTPAPAPAEPEQRPPQARSLWAMLLARMYESFPLTCGHCRSELKLVAFVTEAGPIQRLLIHIGKPATRRYPRQRADRPWRRPTSISRSPVPALTPLPFQSSSATRPSALVTGEA